MDENDNDKFRLVKGFRAIIFLLEVVKALLALLGRKSRGVYDVYDFMIQLHCRSLCVWRQPPNVSFEQWLADNLFQIFMGFDSEIKTYRVPGTQ